MLNINYSGHILSAVILSVLLSVNTQVISGQYRISGFVRDKITGELLLGAHIIETGTYNAVISNNNGFFTLVTQNGNPLTVSFVGYQPYILNYPPGKDTLAHIFLEPGSRLDEVVVKSLATPRFNVTRLSEIEMQSIPSIGGKPDVMKTLQLLPGIQPQNEGSSVMLVRGGGPGENLYLFDNVPVIYVNHLGGFTSVFNPDMINRVDVYKGGFPARYGGKISSVVDITQREGATSGYKGSFSIGVTDASFTLEGPLKLKNSTFLVTGRKTLVDPLLAGASKLSDGNTFIVSYGYHDINGKFSWKPDDKNTLHLNVYQGDDYLNYWSDKKDMPQGEKHRMTNTWGNWLVSARWNRVVSPKLFTVNTISYVRYRLKDKVKYSISGGSEMFNYERRYLSSVQDISYRSGWKYTPLRFWSVDFGLQSSLLLHQPNSTFQSDQPVRQSGEPIRTFESVVYFENRMVFSKHSEVNLGARLGNYAAKGYHALQFEPRLNLNIGLSENHTLNAGYMKVSQYSHLMFAPDAIMSSEVWIPAGKDILPAHAHQVSVGWHGMLLNKRLQVETDLYYKKMVHLSTYKEGYTSMAGDVNWRSKVETGGEGIAKGVEFSIRKQEGKWTGFAGYTWSNANRRFDNINNGNEYLYDFDRPHTASVNISRQLNEKLLLNAVWVYQTGLPYTPAIGRHLTPGIEYGEEDELFYYEVLVYGDRNSERMRDYHRLDVALNYTRHTKKRNNKATWTFGIYNVYNRQNPYFYYYNNNNTGEIHFPQMGDSFKPLSLYQMSFFPIIPYISYKVHFDKNSYTQKEDRPKFGQRFKNWLYHEN